MTSKDEFGESSSHFLEVQYFDEYKSGLFFMYFNAFAILDVVNLDYGQP